MEKKILKLEHGSQIEIRAFEMTHLQPGSLSTFRTPTLESKKKPVMPSTSGRELARKDLRFHVDPAVGDLLVAEVDLNEESIQMRVSQKVEELRASAEIRAKEEGFNEGLRRGEAEASEKFEAIAQEKVKRLDSLIQSYEGIKEEVFQVNERFLVELVLRMGSVILQKEIALDPEYLGRVIRSVVEKVGVKEQLRIIASSSQLDLVYGLLPELEKRHLSLKNISVEASSQLNESDVVIETDFNRIDATLDSQLGSLREVVLAALEKNQSARNSEPAAQ